MKSWSIITWAAKDKDLFLLEPQRVGNVGYGTTEVHFPPCKWGSRCGVGHGEFRAVHEDGQHVQNFYVGYERMLYTPNSGITLHF